MHTVFVVIIGIVVVSKRDHVRNEPGVVSLTSQMSLFFSCEVEDTHAHEREIETTHFS